MTDTRLTKEIFEDGGWVTHYKGNVYFVHGVFTHTETGESLVTYSDMNKAWARPLNMFYDTVELTEPYEGKAIVPRFRKATPKEIDNHCRQYLDS